MQSSSASTPKARSAVFTPTTGRVALLRPPTGPGVRFDSGLSPGAADDRAFDSMLAKLIVHGSDRHQAIARMRQALRDLVLLGCDHNVVFRARARSSGVRGRRRCTPAFLEEHREELALPQPAKRRASQSNRLCRGLRSPAARRGRSRRSPTPRWGRGGIDVKHCFTIAVRHELWLAHRPAVSHARFGRIGPGRSRTSDHRVSLHALGEGEYRLDVDGIAHRVWIAVCGDAVHIHAGGRSWTVELVDELAETAAAAGPARRMICRRADAGRRRRESK